ncbi:MAG: cupin domain-containing protein [Usitatibacteraceae bacterium]
MNTHYAEIPAFVTKDGSLIRELMHPAQHGPSTMSFAEATVEPGATTQLHLHPRAEEIYHITQGSGTMRLGDAEFEIRAGDTITIAPGTRHNVTNTGAGAMKILCACHPAYSDQDTTLL